ncbi:Hypothetical protein, putative [Bodo saltans]|uniref:Guanine nucleotide-binding protein subunit beta-like protein n=1 Tax=Bodo saltans TaxID=75058 RepID=A0A0S4ITC3_BODSA|nr:Hypothetical protein, putative [Bodo saltans]|eukprot:CUF80678.1 Hypothetical protein, putative [Bodo saltans]
MAPRRKGTGTDHNSSSPQQARIHVQFLDQPPPPASSSSTLPQGDEGGDQSQEKFQAAYAAKHDVSGIAPFVDEPATLSFFPSLHMDDYVGCADRITGVAIDVIGWRLIASSYDDTARVWKIQAIEAANDDDDDDDLRRRRSKEDDELSASAVARRTIQREKLEHGGVLPSGVLTHSDWVNCVGVVYPLSSSSDGGITPAAAAAARHRSGGGAAFSKSTNNNNAQSKVLAVTGCEDGCFTAWDLDSLSAAFQLRISHGAVTSLCVCDDVVLAASLFDVYLVSCSAQCVLRRFTQRCDATAIALSPDGTAAFIGHIDGSISCWDVASAVVTREIHPTTLLTVAEQRALDADPDAKVKPPKRSPVRSLSVDKSHAAGSKLVGTTDDGIVQVWSTSTGELLHQKDIHNGKPVLASCTITQRRKRRTGPPAGSGGGGAAGTISPPSQPLAGNPFGGGAVGKRPAPVNLATPSKAISPKFHDATKVFVVTCGFDGTVNVTDLDNYQVIEVSGAYAFCVASLVASSSAKGSNEVAARSPTNSSQQLTWCVVVGDNEGRVRTIDVTSAIQRLDDR